MTSAEQELRGILGVAGGSKTIYALVMPETEAALAAVVDGGSREDTIAGALAGAERRGSNANAADTVVAALDTAREPFRDMYRAAWTQRQDADHVAFFERWRAWTAPVLDLDAAAFPFCYPTAGASEGLRAAIDAYGNRARAEAFAPSIHVFAGEYEGFGAYAEAARIPLVRHRRQDWRAVPSRIGPRDQFYISQPSAIDGAIWPSFDAFAQALAIAQPTAELMLDLTYVGCVARPYRLKADYPNVPMIFFSLSKPAGAYYHRIGGCLARREHSGLFGNMWFKNLLSLRLGIEFMNRNSVRALAEKYRPVQEQAARDVGAKLGVTLAPCDVYLLATARPSAVPGVVERYLLRGEGDDARVRVCVTPAMAHLIGTA